MCGRSVLAIGQSKLLETLSEVEDAESQTGAALAVCGSGPVGARHAQHGRERTQLARSLGLSREQPLRGHVASRIPAGTLTPSSRPLGRWAQDCLGEGEASIAIDGKTLQRLHGRELPGVRLAAAYTGESGLVLGQKGDRR